MAIAFRKSSDSAGVILLAVGEDSSRGEELVGAGVVVVVVVVVVVRAFSC